MQVVLVKLGYRFRVLSMQKRTAESSFFFNQCHDLQAFGECLHVLQDLRPFLFIQVPAVATDNDLIDVVVMSLTCPILWYSRVTVVRAEPGSRGSER